VADVAIAALVGRYIERGEHDELLRDDAPTTLNAPMPPLIDWNPAFQS
jgi:hypothetical protein